MSFISLSTIDQLESIKVDSKPSVLFKHSTRCSISSMALSRMERGLEPLSEKFNVYYLDLIRYRSVSNEIADIFKIEHASPQVLIIQNGECIYDASHGGISPSEMLNVSI